MAYAPYYALVIHGPHSMLWVWSSHMSVVDLESN